MRADARAHGWVALLAAVLLSTGCVTLDEAASAEPVPQQPPSCGGQAVPAGWPDFSSHDSQALLAPFLTCSAPAEYVALQEHVDMPRLVESLTDWDAVRLGSLGPVREDAAGLLNRKRLAFLLRATDRYGVAHAEVFVRFLLDSAYDEELREILFWLARDKRLETTLGRMPRARADRDFQPGDLLRGASRAVTDLLTHEQQKNAWYTHYARQRGQLPPSYQQDLDEVEWEAARQHYSAGNVLLGSVDHVTFGVPLGFYYLAAGTGHGLSSLSRGELARYIQARREAGRFVAVGGMDAALALYEARGEVAKARPLMSRARPGATGAPLERQGTLASLVDEGVGHTPTVVEAKLAAAEQEATGPRLPMDVRVLRQHHPALDTPPPEARGNPRWREYVDYYEKRLGEVKKGEASKGPLKWEGYEPLRRWFARGLAFERDMVRLLQEDAKKPRAERRFLGDFDKPRVEMQVGVRKPGSGLRYADVLVIEEGGVGGQPRRVETFSFKSRDLTLLEEGALRRLVIEDAKEALRKYGGSLDIRRDSLQRSFGAAAGVPVQRVRLIYEGGALKPTKVDNLDAVVTAAEEAVPGVEVLFQ